MDKLHENSSLIPYKLLHHSSLTAILQMENPNCTASLISYMSLHNLFISRRLFPVCMKSCQYMESPALLAMY